MRTAQAQLLPPGCSRSLLWSVVSSGRACVATPSCRAACAGERALAPRAQLSGRQPASGRERGAQRWSSGSSAGVGAEARAGVSPGRSSSPSCSHRRARGVLLELAGRSQWPEVVGAVPLIWVLLAVCRVSSCPQPPPVSRTGRARVTGGVTGRRALLRMQGFQGRAAAEDGTCMLSAAAPVLYVLCLSLGQAFKE